MGVRSQDAAQDKWRVSRPSRGRAPALGPVPPHLCVPPALHEAESLTAAGGHRRPALPGSLPRGDPAETWERGQSRGSLPSGKEPGDALTEKKITDCSRRRRLGQWSIPAPFVGLLSPRC